ncbi:MAG TPA: cardiolipin synthase ClsB [Rhodocyclaceae bacterium]|nr:cardiolipin synthase ClsB [Rhodocyclaceae bacterium]
MNDPVFMRGNAIELLRSGTEYFPALMAAIDAAKAEVRLDTYIFNDDETGRRIAETLSRAARRGVRVHVLVDGFGSSGFMETLGADMRRDGVEVLVYRPEIARFRLKRQRLRRLHRKLVCVDGCIAFVGGINIIDDVGHAHRHRLDFAVRITGPLLSPIYATMVKLWNTVRWASFGQRYHAAPPKIICVDGGGELSAAFITRSNFRQRRAIEDGYLSAIQRAQHQITIANAYFLPGRRFRRALIDATQRGVVVTLLLEGRSEHWLQYYATQALYGQLLGAGITIHEYRQGLLHAKVAVIDDDWATVGSSNLDPFSLMLAREANVVVRNASFAAQLRHEIEQAIASGGTQITYWMRLYLPRRIFAWTCYGIVRALIGLIGFNETGVDSRSSGSGPSQP